MLIEPQPVPVGVFTAPADSIYVFVLRLIDSGVGVLRKGAEALLSLVAGAGGQAPLVVYLAGGEELTYSGPAAELFGVRLGNEL